MLKKCFGILLSMTLFLIHNGCVSRHFETQQSDSKGEISNYGIVVKKNFLKDEAGGFDVVYFEFCNTSGTGRCVNIFKNKSVKDKKTIEPLIPGFLVVPARVVYNVAKESDFKMSDATVAETNPSRCLLISPKHDAAQLQYSFDTDLSVDKVTDKVLAVPVESLFEDSLCLLPLFGYLQLRKRLAQYGSWSPKETQAVKDFVEGSIDEYQANYAIFPTVENLRVVTEDYKNIIKFNFPQPKNDLQSEVNLKELYLRFLYSPFKDAFVNYLSKQLESPSAAVYKINPIRFKLHSGTINNLKREREALLPLVNKDTRYEPKDSILFAEMALRFGYEMDPQAVKMFVKN